jgi:hypothetical protein
LERVALDLHSDFLTENVFQLGEAIVTRAGTGVKRPRMHSAPRLRECLDFAIDVQLKNGIARNVPFYEVGVFRVERECRTPRSKVAKIDRCFFAALRLGVSLFPLKSVEPEVFGQEPTNRQILL